MPCPVSGGILKVHRGIAFEVSLSYCSPGDAGHVHEHGCTVQDVARYTALVAQRAQHRGHILALVGTLVVGQTQSPCGSVRDRTEFGVLLSELIPRERRLLGHVIAEG